MYPIEAVRFKRKKLQALFFIPEVYVHLLYTVYDRGAWNAQLQNTGIGFPNKRFIKTKEKSESGRLLKKSRTLDV